MKMLTHLNILIHNRIKLFLYPYNTVSYILIKWNWLNKYLFKKKATEQQQQKYKKNILVGQLQ